MRPMPKGPKGRKDKRKDRQCVVIRLPSNVDIHEILLLLALIIGPSILMYVLIISNSSQCSGPLDAEYYFVVVVVVLLL